MAVQTIVAHLQSRYDTATNWATNNPTLLAGEMGVESDTSKFRFGDGTTAWNDFTGYATDATGTAATLIAAHNADVAAHAGLFMDKVDKVLNKGLSTVDFTDEAYVHTDNNYTASDKTTVENISGVNTGNETVTSIGTLINGATAKTTPVDADMVGLMDSAASNVLKKLSWANIKATLGSTFAAVSHTQVASTITDFASTVLSTALTGLSIATATAITAADTVLSSIGKLQAQITANDTAAVHIATDEIITGGKAFAKGAVFYGSDISFPTAVGTYTAAYDHATYGARLLAYNGSAYQPLHMGAMPTAGKFGLNLYTDGSVSSDYNFAAPNVVDSTAYPATVTSGTVVTVTITGYTVAKPFYIRLGSAITAASTLSINSGTAYPLIDSTGTAIANMAVGTVLQIYQATASSSFQCLLNGKQDLSGLASTALYTATITTTWTGSSAPYTQTIAVTGMLATDTPFTFPVFSSTNATAILQQTAWNLVGEITTATDSITVTCFTTKPTTAIPIQMKVVR